MHPGHDIERAIATLQLRGIDCATDEPMARHTTYRVGGSAAVLVTPDSVAALCEALDVLAECGVEVAVVGGGSNLLVSDAGFDGAVVKLGEGFQDLEVDGTRIRAGGALALARVVGAARDHGLTGLEYAHGIPGTVGGAIAMNAGSRDEWIGSMVRSVTYVVRPDAPSDSGDSGAHVPTSPVTVFRDSVEWGYRSTSIRDRAVVTEVILELAHGDREAIGATMAAAAAKRRTTQPMGLPNAGSVFRNPPVDSAGRLIEASGLKGHRIGGAEVSTVHANFIVTHPGATASDVHGLMQHVQREVVEHFGVELTPEIRFLGRF